MASSATNWKPIPSPRAFLSSLAYRAGTILATTPRRLASAARGYHPPKDFSTFASAFRSGQRRAGVARALRAVRRSQYKPFRAAALATANRHKLFLAGAAALYGANKLYKAEKAQRLNYPYSGMRAKKGT